MKHKTIFILICMLMCSLASHAQPNSVRRQSAASHIPEAASYSLTPNAASIQRYHDMPVSLYTGVPDITIPLYTFRSGKLSLPISLSYHAGGIKPEEHPGWVGLGWTLRAGGTITRIKHGLPDELNGQGVLSQLGYFHRHDLASEEMLEYLEDDDFLTDFFMSNGHIYDREPDEFNFSFNGYSGTFLMDAQGKWQVRCERPLSVEMHSYVNPPSTGEEDMQFVSRIVSGFTLTTDEGVQYFFGGDAIDLSNDLVHQNKHNWEATAWHLYKIIHPNGDTIDLTYERGDYTCWMGYADHTFFFDSGNMHASSSSARYYGCLLSPVYLSGISSEYGAKIAFRSSRSKELSYSLDNYLSLIEYSNTGNSGYSFYYLSNMNCSTLQCMTDKIQWRQLDSIEVTDDESKRLKQISFLYDNKKEERLLLGEVSLRGQLDCTEESYKFRYNSPSSLPPYLTMRTDHWGYYNATASILNNSEEAREPNPAVLGYGTLQEITYPTGGKSVFEFEPHRYARQVPLFRGGACEKTEERVAGGLRIRKITHCPGNGQPAVVKEYVYKRGYQPGKESGMSCSGILEGRPLYSAVYNFAPGNNGILANGSSNSLLPCGNAAGIHISYSEVAERCGDGSYTIYTFTNADEAEYADQYADLVMAADPLLPFSSRACYRGKLRQKREYDSNGHLMREESIKYAPLNDEQTFVRGICTSARSYTGYDLSFSFACYRQYVYSLLPFSRSVKTYDRTSDATSLCVETVYAYNNEGQLTKEQVRIQAGDETDETITGYCYEWEENGAFKQRHLLAFVREVLSLRNGKDNGATLMAYGLADDNTPFVRQVSERQAGGRATRTLYQCTDWDEKGNPVREVRNGLGTVYLWGYDRNHPVAEVRNAETAQVSEALDFEAQYIPYFPHLAKERIDTLRRKLPGSEVIGYESIPRVGVTGVTGGDRLGIGYEYDAYGRLAKEKDSEGKTVKDYAVKMDTGVDPDSEEYNQAVRKFFENLQIYGPGNLPPGEELSFWIDLQRMPGHYGWRLEGDTAGIKMTVLGTRVKLRNNRTGTLGGIQLWLDLTDKNGKPCGSIMKDIRMRKDPLIFKVEKLVGEGSPSQTRRTISLHAADFRRLQDCDLYINGKWVTKGTAMYTQDGQIPTDPSFTRSTGGIRFRGFQINNDGKPFCQIMIIGLGTTEPYFDEIYTYEEEATEMFTVSEDNNNN